MNKELNIYKESDIYDSNFEVTFQLNGLEYWCSAYVRYDYDGCYLTDHEFTFELEPYHFDDIQKHELIKAIDEYFCTEWSMEYQDKYCEDMYYDNEQRIQDAGIDDY